MDLLVSLSAHYSWCISVGVSSFHGSTEIVLRKRFVIAMKSLRGNGAYERQTRSSSRRKIRFRLIVPDELTSENP